ncbi:MAG TPA: MTAP family purine nucleoside phosphorylase [Solirubrobacteraceae bacterium]|nr:MTAP family purine nucleoside phosphorylase [Solirubrobacteraceae bacterium]
MKLGILTGSGTYALDELERPEVREIQTRFGGVTATEGRLAGVDVVHVSRHGQGHVRLSSHVNHRANTVALREAGVDAILAVTVCGAVDRDVELGSLIVFDDLHFLVNRLADGSVCSLYAEGEPGRGHWIFDRPFSQPLRQALLAAAAEIGGPTRDGGCYGHVDGPRFNSRTEIRMLAQCGVTAVSQTAGAETVLAGEAGLPYALLGYATDYANGVIDPPTPVAELVRLIEASTGVFGRALAAAVPRLAGATIEPTGSHFRFD